MAAIGNPQRVLYVECAPAAPPVEAASAGGDDAERSLASSFDITVPAGRLATRTS